MIAVDLMKLQLKPILTLPKQPPPSQVVKALFFGMELLEVDFQLDSIKMFKSTLLESHTLPPVMDLSMTCWSSQWY